MIPAVSDRNDGLARRFLAWAKAAPPDARATGTGALARAVMGSEFSQAERVDAIAALTLALDDPHACVRRALAVELADSSEAPRHLIQSLAADEDAIARIVIARSPRLPDSDLIEFVATRSEDIQIAVASREGLSAPVAAALAEVGEAQPVCVLASRRDVSIPDFSLVRMAERFAADPGVMQAMLTRQDLPFEAKYALMVERQLASRSTFDRPEQALREARERTALEIAGTLSPDELPCLVRYLRAASQLTASLLLRAVVCGPLALFQHALADLGAMPLARVAALCAEHKGGGFQALCRKIGLSAGLCKAMVAALDARRNAGAYARMGSMSQLLEARRILGHVLDRLRPAEADATLLAALRRLDVELEGQQARRTAETLLPQDRVEQEQPLLLDKPVTLPMKVAESGAPDIAAVAFLAVSRALFDELETVNVDARPIEDEYLETELDGGFAQDPEPADQPAASPGLVLVHDETAAAHACAIPDEPIEVVVSPQARASTVLRFSEIVDVAREWAGVTCSPSAAPIAPVSDDLEHNLDASCGTDLPEPVLATLDDVAGAAPLAPAPVELVTVLTPADLAGLDPHRDGRPSPAAIAAMLENAIAAALTSVPAPQIGQAVLEVLRPAPVIEGDWIGISAQRTREPGHLQSAAA